MNIEPTKPYIYQPFGMQDEEQWQEGKIYGVGGIPLAKIQGLTRQEAEKILKNTLDRAVSPWVSEMGNGSG